jgi:hypothetical protein
MLEVVEVGSFEASFVPTLADFGRLSPIFRLPAQVWEQLPGYRDYGFAVFKLKPGRHEIHPMALAFRTRFDRHVFYPTLHVHDGTVPAFEKFDHAFYLQCRQGQLPWGWEASSFPFDHEVELHKSAGVVTGEHHGARLLMRHPAPNADQIIPVGEGLPERPYSVPTPPEAPKPEGLREGLTRKKF